jgi:phenylalanine-4-hydroxylase
MKPGAFSPAADLVELDQDHPGFRDLDYRARRNTIAKVALDYRGGPVPAVPYSEAEQGVWKTVWEQLGPLHESLAASPLLRAADALALDRQRIPQLVELNPRLREATGFEMLPVAGLVAARTFLTHLGRGVFLSTQYIRHASAPLYTPEPDVVHELVGHAATLIEPRLAELSRTLGQAALRADDAGIAELERVYWYTLEFGAVVEAGQVKALGAGLLSSPGEIQRFAAQAELREWDLESMARTDYDPTTYQPWIYVAPSFDRALADLAAWAKRRFG